MSEVKTIVAKAETLSDVQIDEFILKELQKSSSTFGVLIGKIGGYHGPNYRALDKGLQRLRKRGSIELMGSPRRWRFVTEPVGG